MITISQKGMSSPLRTISLSGGYNKKSNKRPFIFIREDNRCHILWPHAKQWLSTVLLFLSSTGHCPLYRVLQAVVAGWMALWYCVFKKTKSKAHASLTSIHSLYSLSRGAQSHEYSWPPEWLTYRLTWCRSSPLKEMVKIQIQILFSLSCKDRAWENLVLYNVSLMLIFLWMELN